MQHFLYDAFISYRHVERDRKWAEWLIDALERYPIPKLLQAKRAFPRLHVFRDEDEVPASSDLNDQIKQALISSQYLIVICSAFTPRSKWVQREIEIFNELGRSNQVLALLTEGEPGDSFPAPMLEQLQQITDATGINHTVTTEKEPLAADVRPRSNKSIRELKRLALLRLVAVILGVKFDELRQRQRERVRKLWINWLFAAATLCSVTAASVFSYWTVSAILLRPSTTYYRDIVWHSNIPEGAGPIDRLTQGDLATSFGITVQRMSVTQRPVVREVEQYAHGYPSLNELGFSKIWYSYDRRGDVIELAYFGPDGLPIIAKNGYARSIYSYDQRGDVVQVAYFGPNGLPITAKNGYARSVRIYDDKGHETEVTYFDANGNKVAPSAINPVKTP